MLESALITAARNGDVQLVSKLLEGDTDVNAQDEHGWSALAWAAGSGNVEIAKILLDHNANAVQTGRDNRTPLMIARAANRSATVRLLTETEQRLGVWQNPRDTCAYAKAYYLRDLRRFADWSEKSPVKVNVRLDVPGSSGPDALADDHIVYIHQDFTVTKSMWHGEDVIFDDVNQAWRIFCESTLEFAIPEDVF